MAPPTPEELETLRRLAQTREGRLLVRVFQSRLARLDNDNRRAIGDNLIRGQGRALELEDILKDLLGLTDSAPTRQLQSKAKQPNRLPAIDRYRVNHMAD